MNNSTLQYLPSNEKKVYTSICAALLANRKSIIIPNLYDTDKICDILCRCLLDTPSAINFKSELTFRKNLFSQTFDIGEIPIGSSIIWSMKNELNEKVNQILLNTELKKCTCDSEILYFIYKYIQTTTKYDYETIKYNQHPISHTAYGSLVNHLSVCDGNAKGMILLCQKLGIPCMGINGKMNNSEHSWVIVQCDGKWFHSDPTFEYLCNDIPDYSHWLQSDDEIGNTHQWDRTAYPICHSQPMALINKNQDTLSRSITNSFPSEKEGFTIVKSISVFQKIAEASIINNSKSIVVKFAVQLSDTDLECYLEIFNHAVEKFATVTISYTYTYYTDRRILIIEWE